MGFGLFKPRSANYNNYIDYEQKLLKITDKFCFTRNFDAFSFISKVSAN